MSRSTWSSESAASGFQHQIFYTLIRLRAEWIVTALLRAVVLYYVLFRPSLRRRAEPYLSHRFPGTKGTKKMKLVYALDLEFGETLVERAKLGIVGPDSVMIHFPDKEELRAIAQEEKGMLLMMAHVGGWQVVMSALRFLNLPVNLLLHRDEGDVDRQYFEHGRIEERRLKIIDPADGFGGMLAVMDVLKKGEVVCVMGDRVFGNPKNTVDVRFLGDRVPVPFSAFKVASATGSPVVVLFSFRSGPGKYILTLDHVMRIPPGLGRSGQAFEPYAARFMKGLEAFVTAHPFQFHNFYDMWQRIEE